MACFAGQLHQCSCYKHTSWWRRRAECREKGFLRHKAHQDERGLNPWLAIVLELLEGLEGIALIKAIQTGWLHPTINQVRQGLTHAHVDIPASQPLQNTCEVMLCHTSPQALISCFHSLLMAQLSACAICIRNLWYVIIFCWGTTCWHAGQHGRWGWGDWYSTKCEERAWSGCRNFKFLWIWRPQLRCSICPFQGGSMSSIFVSIAVEA